MSDWTFQQILLWWFASWLSNFLQSLFLQVLLRFRLRFFAMLKLGTCHLLANGTASWVFFKHLIQKYSSQQGEGEEAVMMMTMTMTITMMTMTVLVLVLVVLKVSTCSGTVYLTMLSEVRRRPLLVISVIGVQSSGKSTLMNYLFGCSFATHVGRCTKDSFVKRV